MLQKFTEIKENIKYIGQKRDEKMTWEAEKKRTKKNFWKKKKT